MKKKIKYSLFVGAAALMTLNSCSMNEFLDVTHYSILESSTVWETDENALAGLNGCYDLMFSDGALSPDPFNIYELTGSHPTLDSQAGGRDKDFMTQSWTPEHQRFLEIWKQNYACICRCNDYLAGLETADRLSEDLKPYLEGEARSLRGYMYFFLATTFGRVPMLSTGENYSNTPAKARAETYAEMWDFIIQDFEAASELLQWTPYAGEYGRATKGMALTYLGDAYMWKAYRCPETAKDCYAKAASAFKQVIESGTYKLNESFTTLWDAAEAWPKEAIWQVVLNEGDLWASYDNTKTSGAKGSTGLAFGPESNGGWGSYHLSWELYDAFEDGDKRRDGSMVTATIPESELQRVGKMRWKQTFVAQPEWLAHEKNAAFQGVGSVDFSDVSKNIVKYDKDCPMGYNPWIQEFVNVNTFRHTVGDQVPSIYSSKHWRNGRTHWNSDRFSPDHLYLKRLANVMLDYAECLFQINGEDDATAWGLINELRNRAFGNLEVGKSEELTAKYLPHVNTLAAYYSGKGVLGEAVVSDVYPLPFSDEHVTVPDARVYYAELKAEKGFSSPVWKVAVNEERRKEFTGEFNIRADMQKSGYMTDHIEHNYPKGRGVAGGIESLYSWQTYRDYDYDERKLDMPIPQDELLKNPLCDQNPGY